MLTYPDIDPVIFSIGPISVRWYGLMYVIGFVLAWWLARKRCERSDSPVDAEQVDDLVFYSMLGVIIGGRIGSMLFYNFDKFLEALRPQTRPHDVAHDGFRGADRAAGARFRPHRQFHQR
jgi:prolipoprotein diacylglyceryl transferase